MKCEKVRYSSRNYSIDLLKLYFAVCIALGHANWLREGFGTSVPTISSGMIVLLFYVLSGFFLVKSFDSNKYNGSCQYTYARLKRIYKYYIVAFLLLLVYSKQHLLKAPMDLFTTISKSLPEILLVQNVGIFDGGINYPLWQMSCLIVASHIFFGMLKWNRHATLNVICPTLVLCTFTALANVYGAGNLDGWGVEGKFIYVPFLRAAGSIALGMVAYTPMNALLKEIENRKGRFVPFFVFLTSILAGIVLWNNRNSYAIVFPFIILIVCMFYSRGVYARLFRHPLFSKLEGLSLAVYFTHATTIQIFNRNRVIYENLGSWEGDLLYIAVVLAVSCALITIVDMSGFLLKKIRKSNKRKCDLKAQ